MYPLLETIKCKDGKLYNLEFHQARFENAQKEYFGISPKIKLFEEIQIPELAETGLFRCRVTYSKQIDSIEFFPHHYRDIKNLKLVEDNSIDYHLKFADREKLQNLFERRENCDDIIIVKNGFISDSYTANVVLFDGGNWVTPDTPILLGTQRARLIKENKIKVCKITHYDLRKYNKAGLINALWDMENMPIIDIKNILK